MENIEKLDKKNNGIVFYIIAILSLFVFYNNSYLFRIIPIFRYILIIRIILSFFLLLLLTVKHGLSKQLLYLIILAFEILLVTFINNGSFLDAISNISNPISVIVFLEVVNNKKRDLVIKLFDVWKWIMLFLLVIDLFTILRYPAGLYINDFSEKHWFLGYKTQRMTIVLPMVFFFAFISIIRKNKIGIITYIVMLLSIVDTLLCSATIATTSLIIILIGMILIDLNKSNKSKWNSFLLKAFNYRIWIPLVFGITFFVSWMQWEKIIYFIGDFFGKSYTLSNRTILWQDVTSMIKNKLVFGYGFLTANQYRDYIFYTNAHCFLLTILVDGGLLALIIYLIYLYSCFRGINNSKLAIFICLYIYFFHIQGITSSVYLFSPFYFVPFYCLAYYCKDIQPKRIRFSIEGAL